MSYPIIRRGEIIATVTADTYRDALYTAQQRFGAGVWLLPAALR